MQTLVCQEQNLEFNSQIFVFFLNTIVSGGGGTM